MSYCFVIASLRNKGEVMPGNGKYALPKVLILEEDEFVKNLYRRALAGRVEILAVSDVTSASILFVDNLDLDAVVIDSGKPNNEWRLRMEITALIVTTKIGLARRKKKIPIIATSAAAPVLMDSMVEAGCTHRCPNDEKYKLPHLLIELTGVKPSAHAPTLIFDRPN